MCIVWLGAAPVAAEMSLLSIFFRPRHDHKTPASNEQHSTKSKQLPTNNSHATMVPITTYQSMCSDVLCEGRAIVSPPIHANASHSSSKQHSSRLLLSMSKSKCSRAPKKKAPNEPIPLYFAWDRLDPSYEEDGTDKHGRHDGRDEVRPPPQCQIDDDRENPRRAKVHVPAVAPSSHHFLVDPDIVQDEEPFITEYADKYRAWTIPLMEKATTKARTNKGRRHKSSDGERGVELALRGISLSQTPPRTQNQKPPFAPSLSTTGSSLSRRQPRVNDGFIITCDDRGSSGTAKKSSELDEESCLTGTTATTSPSTPAGGSYDADVEDGSIPSTTSPMPAPTPAKSDLTEEDGDIWLITSGNCIKKQAPKHQSTKLTKLRETRRDMPFWKSSSSSSLGIPISTTPNHSVSKGGRARRFGEKNSINSRSARTRSTSTAATCPSPQKLSRMLLTSRRGLSSAKLFPRLPNDPFRKDALKRKV